MPAKPLVGAGRSQLPLRKITMHPSLCTLPPDAQVLMDRIGPVWGADIQKHRDMVLNAYAPVLAAAPKQGVTITRDVAYGSHPRHRLDVFHPAGAADRKNAAPVVIFMHGGAFVRGDKRASSEVYDNLLIWFAHHGYVGVNIEFRLAPMAH